MATRRSTPALVDQTGAPVSPPQTISPPELFLPDDDAMPNDVALISVLEQIGESDTETSVNVYRINSDGGKNTESYLQKFTPQEFARDGLDELRRLYGGGEYRVRVYGAAGRLVANKRISIEAPKGFKPGAQIESENLGSVRELATMMQQGFQTIAQTIASALQAQQRPQESRTDFLKEMAMMREIFKPEMPAHAPQNTEGKAIEMFLKGIQLARETLPKAGEATETDLLLEGIRLFGGPIAEAMKTGASKPAAVSGPSIPAPPVPGIPAQAFPVAVIPAASSQPETAQQNELSQEQQQMQIAVKQALSFMVAQAKADNDPSTYAAMILDHVSEDEIRAMLSAPEWIDNLAKLNPEVKQYAPWFEELKQALLAELTIEEKPGISSPNAAS